MSIVLIYECVNNLTKVHQHVATGPKTDGILKCCQHIYETPPTTSDTNFASSNLSSSCDGGVANPAGEKSKPGECPDKCEDPEAGVAGLCPSGVAQKLRHLEPVVRKVVDDEDQGAHPVHVVAPAEGEEGQGGHVVDEHLPEVLDARQVQRQFHFLPFALRQRTG